MDKSTTAICEQKRIIQNLKMSEQDGTFSGYASLFGKVDLGKDRVERGAFSASLKARGDNGIRMLFQHDPAEPIGVWHSVKEDGRGLFVAGRITEESAKGREVLALLRTGAIDGLSIGFRTTRAKTDRKTGIRTILEADLWEVSVVTFPMLPQARVTAVKQTSINTHLPSVREFERWLTRDAGLRRSEAKTIISKGFTHLTGMQDAADPNDRQFSAKLRRAAKHIQQEMT